MATESTENPATALLCVLFLSSPKFLCTISSDVQTDGAKAACLVEAGAKQKGVWGSVDSVAIQPRFEGPSCVWFMRST